MLGRHDGFVELGLDADLRIGEKATLEFQTTDLFVFDKIIYIEFVVTTQPIKWAPIYYDPIKSPLNI